MVGVLETFDLQPKNNNIFTTAESKEKLDKQTKDEASENGVDLSSKVAKITKLNGFSKPITPPSTSPVRAVLRSVVDKKQAVQNLEIHKQLSDEECKTTATACDTREEEPTVPCKWMDCKVKLHHARELSEHVHHCHVEPMASQDVFVCLWEGCKVFNKASCSHSWLSKHINTHTGDKPFKCMISGCSLSFSSQEGLARHVPTHFNEPKPPKRQKTDNESPKKVFKKRRLKFIRPRRAPEQVKEDTVDKHTVESIKERLPNVMPLSCYKIGINGAKITFQSKVLGKRTSEKSGEVDVLIRWVPEEILIDEWVPLNEVQKHRTRTVHISQLPNDVTAELDPSFYRRFSHRKHHRK